jgi:hypothetical protein
VLQRVFNDWDEIPCSESVKNHWEVYLLSFPRYLVGCRASHRSLIFGYLLTILYSICNRPQVPLLFVRSQDCQCVPSLI